MENQLSEKNIKVITKESDFATIRVHKETQKRLLEELTRINKKDFGRTVRIDELIKITFSLFTPELARQLQEGSLSNADRLERDYLAYVANHDPILKDVYLGKRLSGEIPGISSDQKNIGNTK